MKTTMFVLMIVAFLFTGCEKESVILQNDLGFLHVKPGGCNSLTSDELKSAGQEQDTVYFSIENDTLDLFVGLNYICCAPFETETAVRADSILILVKDVCQYPQQTCYCKCNCYYTWNFKFTDFAMGIYNYRIDVFDPRIGENSVLFEGYFEL